MDFQKIINAIGMPTILFFIIPLALIVTLEQFCFVKAIEPFNMAKQRLETSTQELEDMRVQYERSKQLYESKQQRGAGADKKVYETEDIQFGTGASFAKPFETMINIAKDSKIRIKSIKYAYDKQAGTDPLVAADIKGYNICEMAITGVGTYSQLKAFLSGILAQPYLVRLPEITMTPWGYDKSILIADFKITLYTKGSK
jgi:hypothetical protein